MDYWELAKSFTAEMNRKYLKRVEKPGNTPTPWIDFPEELLVKRLFEEIEELKVALEVGERNEIADELLDVANFCMFLWGKLSKAKT